MASFPWRLADSRQFPPGPDDKYREPRAEIFPRFLVSLAGTCEVNSITVDHDHA